MSSLFRKVEGPKSLFCQRSLAVSEQGHAAFSGDNDRHSVWVVTFDQELLLQLLTVTFSFQVQLETDR